MEFSHNYTIVDNPNVVPTSCPTIPLGEMINPLPEDQGQDDLGNLELRDLYLPMATVRTMKGALDYNAVFINQKSEGSHLIGSCLFLEGNMKTTLMNGSDGILVSKGHQTMKFDPNNEFAHWCHASAAFHIVHLSVDPLFVSALLPDDEKWSVDLKERLAKNERILGLNPPAISSAQYKAIDTLLNCPLPGKLGVLMMEASVMQIMLYQLYAQFHHDATPPKTKVSARDRELIEEVRNYLSQSFLEPHTMQQLSRRFGTNTHKLMSLHKKVFGVSIFEYINLMKMEHAKRMLQDEGRFVAEVARELGYKNPHHFSAAFKRRHGVVPSYLKFA